jgi:RNA polymerase sigma-70 factor (ECF subfamily)
MTVATIPACSLGPRLCGVVVPHPDRPASRDELRLADGLSRRDPAALAELQVKHGRTVMGFLVRALGDRGAAEDVFQHVFLEVWQRGPTYDPGRASPMTWLMTIARSRAVDQMRRKVPEPRDPVGSPALLEGGADPSVSVDELVEQWRMADLLGRLPVEEADILRRRFYGGLSQREIAEQTGTPLGTVKWRMVQALGRLRDLIDAEERGG